MLQDSTDAGTEFRGSRKLFCIKDSDNVISMEMKQLKYDLYETVSFDFSWNGHIPHERSHRLESGSPESLWFTTVAAKRLTKPLDEPLHYLFFLQRSFLAYPYPTNDILRRWESGLPLHESMLLHESCMLSSLIKITEADRQHWCCTYWRKTVDVDGWEGYEKTSWGRVHTYTNTPHAIPSIPSRQDDLRTALVVAGEVLSSRRSDKWNLLFAFSTLKHHRCSLFRRHCSLVKRRSLVLISPYRMRAAAQEGFLPWSVKWCLTVCWEGVVVALEFVWQFFCSMMPMPKGLLPIPVRILEVDCFILWRFTQFEI